MIREHAKSQTGMVHEVIQVSKKHFGTYFTIRCNSDNFNLGVDGWYNGWKKTNDAVTCKHCLGNRKPRPIVYKLFKCIFQTKEGEQTRYMVAQDETDAGLGLLLQGRVKHTKLQIDITEVKMDKRRFLG